MRASICSVGGASSLAGPLLEVGTAGWMGETISGTTRVTDIIFPGSFQSGTLDFKDHAACKYEQRQGKSITEQLLSGARYFDFSTAEECGDPEFIRVRSDSCVGHPLKPKLDEIAKYVKEHPGEIVLLRIRKGAKCPGHKDLRKLLRKAFHKRLAIWSDVREQKVSEFLKSGKTVILVGWDHFKEKRADRYDENIELDVHANTYSELVDQSVEQLSAPQSSSTPKVLEFVLRPTGTAPNKDCGSVRKCNARLNVWDAESSNNKRLRDVIKNANVVAVDFLNEKFVEKIIEANMYEQHDAMVRTRPPGHKDPPDMSKKNWMAKLCRGTRFPDLVLPGASNAGTGYIGGGAALPLWTRAQYYNITDLLNLGVRYLDLGVSDFNNDRGIPYISNYDASHPLDKALDEVKDFLRENRRESVLVSLRPDGRRGLSPKGEDEVFARVVKKFGTPMEWFYIFTSPIRRLRRVNNGFVLVGWHGTRNATKSWKLPSLLESQLARKEMPNLDLRGIVAQARDFATKPNGQPRLLIADFAITPPISQFLSGPEHRMVNAIYGLTKDYLLESGVNRWDRVRYARLGNRTEEVLAGAPKLCFSLERCSAVLNDGLIEEAPRFPTSPYNDLGQFNALTGNFIDQEVVDAILEVNERVRAESQVLVRDRKRWRKTVRHQSSGVAGLPDWDPMEQVIRGDFWDRMGCRPRRLAASTLIPATVALLSTAVSLSTVLPPLIDAAVNGTMP